MQRIPRPVPLLLLVWLVTFASLAGQTPQAPAPATSGQPAAAATGQSTKPVAKPPAKAPAFDLTKPTLFVVGYAHLDTQWRWDYATTIREYLPQTIRTNFDLIEKYPHYVFNFSGSNRYRMIEEYYPDDYARIKRYVAAGRWFPSGSSVEENDVNSPSAESIIRQILYGKQFFRREFGRTSAEFMLPDCFGFPASLPTILAHVGIKGFSTQKLSASWQPAPHVGGPDSPEKTPEGIPFNVGIWEGPDGKTVIAALNPGGYGSSVTYDLSNTPPPPQADPNQPNRPPRASVNWPERIDVNGRLTGAYTDYMYYGTGDVGGSPTESSVKFMEAIITKSRTPIPPLPPSGRGGQGAQQAQRPWPGEAVQVGDGPVKVVSANAEQMFLNIKPEQAAKMPRYKGDLELINHSAGSITSQTYMKRWNRQNEVLADDAERASVVADWLGGRPYPLKRLNDAWTLVMGGQFHDIIPGTSIPKAYEYSWNDEILASNQFASVLTSAMEAIASAMNTQAKGVPILVYNPLNIEREDVVEAAVAFPGGWPRNARIVGPDGKDVPRQWEQPGTLRFVAKMPPVGFAVFDVQPTGVMEEAISELKITTSSLENARYRVKIDDNGDVASIFDKSLNKEMLAAPLRLEIKTDNPAQWPAWNMDYADQMRAPRAYVGGPAKVRIVENGPVRVGLEITRQAEGSTFVQTVRLSSGDAGNRIEFANAIDWNTKESHLKAVFPLAASNENATYNWDIGTIERTTDVERQFEVASHQWVDLTDKSGAFGATILTDCKNASDKPDDHTLRLTLVRTPGTRTSYTDQGTLDLGHHEFVYGLAAHAGDFRQGQTDWQAERLNQPLVAFQTPAHDGSLGKTFSLLKVNNPRVRVLALKKAEQTDEVIVRLVEMDGRKQDDVRLTFGAPVVAAREVNGAEEAVGPAKVSGGVLVTSFTPFQPRTFAVRLAAPAAAKVAVPLWRAVALPYNQAVASPDRSVSAGNFDGSGRTLAAEMLPADLSYGAIHFRLAPTSGVKPNAVIPRGQTIALPPLSPADDSERPAAAGPRRSSGTTRRSEGGRQFTRLYILAAATTTDQKATFKIDDTPVDLTIQSWGGYIGQWDNRIWRTLEEPAPPNPNQPAPPPGAPPRMRTVQEFTGTIAWGYVKRAPVAWFSSHRHGPDGMAEPYAYSYLFAYAIDMPAGAKTITLPVNERIRVMAITVSNEAAQVLPAHPLYDTLERATPPAATTDKDK